MASDSLWLYFAICSFFYILVYDSLRTMLKIRRFQSTLKLVKRALWTGSEPLSESDPELHNLLKLEKKRQVYFSKLSSILLIQHKPMVGSCSIYCNKPFLPFPLIYRCGQSSSDKACLLLTHCMLQSPIKPHTN